MRIHAAVAVSLALLLPQLAQAATTNVFQGPAAVPPSGNKAGALYITPDTDFTAAKNWSPQPGNISAAGGGYFGGPLIASKYCIGTNTNCITSWSTALTATTQLDGTGDIPFFRLNTTATGNKRTRINFAQGGADGMELGSDYNMTNGTDLYMYNRSNGTTDMVWRGNGDVETPNRLFVGVGTVRVQGACKTWFRGVCVSYNYTDQDTNTFGNGRINAWVKSGSTDAIWGYSDAWTGIEGRSNTGYGIYGYSDSNVGSAGESKTSTGIMGKSDTGWGAYGFSNHNIGVYGQSGDSWGVHGYSETNTAIYGKSNGGWGMHGQALNNGVGVRAESNTGWGLWATSNNNTAVYAASQNGWGVHGQGGGKGGYFERIGTPQVRYVTDNGYYGAAWSTDPNVIPYWDTWGHRESYNPSVSLAEPWNAIVANGNIRVTNNAEENCISVATQDDQDLCPAGKFMHGLAMSFSDEWIKIVCCDL